MSIKEKNKMPHQVIKNQRHSGQNSPLLKTNWNYVKPLTLEKFSLSDWVLLETQRKPYLNDERAKQAIEMLAAQANAPTFGYQINNYEHCLQSATMAMNDGIDEETIVTSLFHDLGFVTNNETHGEFAAAFLKPYISRKNRWLLERHMYFQSIHCTSHPSVNPNIRERWRGHESFEYTAKWVEHYDICSFNPNYQNAPLETFIPMVHRIFSNPKTDIEIPL